MIPEELRAENMVGLYTQFANYASPLAKYFDTLSAPGPGNSISYEVLEYRRAQAKLRAYGGPVPKSKMPSRAKVSYEAIAIGDALEIPVELLNNLREPGSLAVSAQGQVARAIRQSRMNIERRLDFLRAQWLTGGALLSSAGVFPNNAEVNGTAYVDYPSLANSTPLAVDLNYTATHLDGAVAVSWATTSTDIKADLDAAQEVIAQDSGVEDASHIICNQTVYNYILKNDYVQASIAATNQIVQTGRLSEIWGYTIDVIKGYAAFDSETMATDTGAAGVTKLIPGNLVILTTADNTAAGRVLRECKPDDANAPDGARGIWAFSDESQVYPHEVTSGFTWVGGVEYGLPDASYIFADVTSTS
ncbi:MAG TPA: major capsid protein [Phycisphaerae bacterium]|nr:major capsid protein [Phycisphaerae bacterium]